MPVFEDQQQFKKPQKKRTGFAKLAYKLGAKDDNQVNLIMILIFIIFVGATYSVYKNKLAQETTEDNQASITPIDVSAETLEYLEAIGVIKEQY